MVKTKKKNRSVSLHFIMGMCLVVTELICSPSHIIRLDVFAFTRFSHSHSALPLLIATVDETSELP